MKPFEGFETLIDLPETDFDGPQAIVEADEAIVHARFQSIDSHAEIVDAGAEIVDAGADHRRDEYAERKRARNDGSDDRLRVLGHERLL